MAFEDFEDIVYDEDWDGIEGAVRIMINRPKVYNAFRGKTITELIEALTAASLDDSVGVIVITGAGKKAFCTGGDAGDVPEGQAGYGNEMRRGSEIHRLIRFAPKPVIAMVNGYAIGGGNVFVTVSDLAIASETALLGQAGPKVGSFDAGFGIHLAKVVGEKRAREVWFLCRRYTAQQAYEWGWVNAVVPPDKLEEETKKWCKEILGCSPTALKYLKSSFNIHSGATYDIETFAFNSVWQFFESEEAKEGRSSYLEKRSPDWSKFRKKA